MGTLGGFKPREHDTEQSNFESLPLGTYLFEVSTSEWDLTKEDQGQKGIKQAYDVVEPADLAGRKYFQYINFEHPKPIVQKIGNETLAKICRAIDAEFEPDDPEDFITKWFVATLQMGKDSKDKNADGTPKYPARPEIRVYHYPDEGDVPEASVDENQPAPAQKPANDNRPAARPAAAAAPGKKPWGKKAA